MTQLYCTYCGKGREMWCRDCKENHLMTGDEYLAYHGEPAVDDDTYYPTENASERVQKTQ